LLKYESYSGKRSPLHLFNQLLEIKMDLKKKEENKEEEKKEMNGKIA
jgi:hypothetical protein